MSDTTEPTLQQFPAGERRTITANVTNAEQVTVADTLSWTASSGTLTPADDTLSATLDNAALGDTTVTATDPSGLTKTITWETVDNTPANIDLTVS